MRKIKFLFNKLLLIYMIIVLSPIFGVFTHVSALSKCDLEDIKSGRSYANTCLADDTCSVEDGYANTAVVTEYKVPPEWGIRGKLAQLLMVSVSGPQDVDKILNNHVGGVWFQGRQFGNNDIEWIKKMRNAAPLPPIIGADEEGGKVQRFRPIDTIPSALQLGKKPTPEVLTISQSHALKLSQIGVSMSFAPVVDLDGGTSVISGNQRSFSSDPVIVTEKAGAFADGLRASHVIPTFKHFPGHGYADGDSHVRAVTTAPLDVLKSRDLVPYKSLLKNSGSAVMMGHLDVPGLTEPNVPTSLSPAAYKLLRNDYGFQGLVVTDDVGGMEAIKARYGAPEAVSRAIRAGADMALFIDNGTLKSVLDRLESDYNSKALTEERLQDALNHIGNARKIASLNTATTPAAGTPVVATSNDNEATVYNYLVQKGLSPAQTAGLMGNLYQESGINPISEEYKGQDKGGKGIAQWTNSRRITFESAAQKAGVITRIAALNALSDAEKPAAKQKAMAFNLDFLWNEGTNRGDIDVLKKETTPEGAAQAWERVFERAGNPKMENRIKNALRILVKFSGGVVVTSSTSCSLSPTATTDGTVVSISGDHYALVDRLLGNPLVTTDDAINRNDLRDGGKCRGGQVGRVTMSDDLIKLLINLVENTKTEVRISATVSDHQCLSTSGNISNHSYGFAVDIGNEKDAKSLYPYLYANRAALNIDELIFSQNGSQNEQFGAHNLKRGVDHNYSSGVTSGHDDHIHVSTKRG